MSASFRSSSPQSAETIRFTMRDMAVGEGSLWIIGDAVDRRVFRVDPRSGTIRGTTLLPFAPGRSRPGRAAVWVTGSIDDVVARLDPADGRRLQIIHVGHGASGVAIGAGAVWVASALDHVVSRIDPATGADRRTRSPSTAPRARSRSVRVASG